MDRLKADFLFGNAEEDYTCEVFNVKYLLKSVPNFKIILL